MQCFSFNDYDEVLSKLQLISKRKLKKNEKVYKIVYADGSSIEATEEHRMTRRMVRDFAEKEIGPRAEEIDETDLFPDDLLRRMGELGSIGPPFPEEYGGSGLGYTSMVIALEEIARVSRGGA